MTTTAKVERIEFNDRLANDAAKKSAAAAAQRGADALLAIAQRRVPYATGALSATGEASVDGQGNAAISYGEFYGRILRAHANDWEFQDGRSGNWIDEALAEAPNEIMGDMDDAARAAWPRG